MKLKEITRITIHHIYAEEWYPSCIEQSYKLEEHRIERCEWIVNGKNMDHY
jgi:hypothetical protein